MSLELPALHGGDPLGFLASLGLLRLLDAEHPAQIRLSFSPATRCAVLHSPCTTLDEVVDALTAILAKTHPEGALPSTPPGFPLRPTTRSRSNPPPSPQSSSGEADPMRVDREEFTDLAARIHPLGEVAMCWLPSLVTDLATDRSGRAALTPFMAPSGKQNVWTFFRKPFEAVRDNPHHITEALTAWRRIDGFTGEYLDHRVLRSAADLPTGKSTEAGVPAATWLATHALPPLRLTGDGTNPSSTLWHRHGRRTLMLWPLWHPPLTTHGVRTLLEHPALTPNHPRNGDRTPPTIQRHNTAPLGVFSVHGAERQLIPGRKNAGALAPITVHDHTPTQR